MVREFFIAPSPEISTDFRTMSIQLYDTLTREVKPLQTTDGKPLGYYCCGPTVWGPSHIGNFRTFVVNDAMRRVLEIAGMRSHFVRNITDVEDKTIQNSQAAGIALRQFTDRWIEHFHDDCRTLNLLPPDVEPRATDHIQEQIDLLRILLDQGFAYQSTDGSIYYRVTAFERYGRLSRLNPQELESQATTSGGTRNLADEYDRDAVTDFALWKAHRPEDGDCVWGSPWGKGRPGWHLECSAMSMKYLGKTIDLHSGGEDLCFPHHENEIAQSEAATGKTFARHWFHTVHLLVEGKKMSKSMGNYYTLGDLLERGHSPMSIRYTLLSAHYRQQLNFTVQGIQSADRALRRIENAAARLLERAGLEANRFEALQGPPFATSWGKFQPAWKALTEDLNTPSCLGALFNALKELAKTPMEPDRVASELHALGTLTYALGLKLFSHAQRTIPVPDEIRSLAERRWKAREARDWATADGLRDALAAKGWKVMDGKDGYLLESLTPA